MAAYDLTATPVVAGVEVTLAPTALYGGDSFVFSLTSAPSASAIATGHLLTPGADATGALDAFRRGVAAQVFTPDVGGVYVFTVYEVRSRSAAPSFARDTAAPGDGAGELMGTFTARVEALTPVDFPIALATGRGAVLRLGIGDTTADPGGEAALVGYVRSAELVDHADEASRLAAQATAVTAALLALVGIATTTALGDFETRANDLRSKLLQTTHYDTGTWHTADDAVNGVARVASASTAAAIALVNDCRASLIGHMSSVSFTGAGVHTNDDTANEIALAPATTHVGAMVLLSHVRSSYERHRVRGSGATPPVHINAGGDTTNTLSAATLFDSAVVAYLDALAAISPTAPTGESAGVLYATQNAGGIVHRS